MNKCGLEPAECHCYIHGLEERISMLENSLDALIDVVRKNCHYKIDDYGYWVKKEMKDE